MEFIRNIFYNSEENRTRLVIRWILFMTAYIIIMVTQKLALTPLTEIMSHSLLISMPVVIFAFSLILWIGAKLIDRRNISDYGIFYSKEWIYDLIFGLFLGIFLISFVFVLEYLLGWIKITGYYYVDEGKLFPLAVIEYILLYIYVGYYEEAYSRGYLIVNISEGMNFKKTGSSFAIIVAVLFTSFLFGILHSDNPNATFNGWWNIIVIGVLFAYTFVLTKSLAIPIGIHITWNFFQGVVFGFPVSGNEVRATFIKIEQGGNPLWTGGNFGPEAGLVIYFVAVIWLILLHIWLRLRKRPLVVDKCFASYSTNNPDVFEISQPSEF